ncbi:MAG TPA: protein-export chaperone SecB [Abditibacteriaceae bacterium]|jgi:preprotein translocase subunit SecB
MNVSPLPYPLQLEKYWLKEVTFKAQMEFQKTDENSGAVLPRDPNLSFDVSFIEVSEESRQWISWLTVELKDPEANRYSHVFKLEIIGFFRVQSDFPGNIEHLIEIGAPSLLYAVVREMVVHVTSHSPSPPVYLPTVTFYKPPPEEGEATKVQEVVASSPKAALPPEEKEKPKPRPRVKKASPKPKATSSAE